MIINGLLARVRQAASGSFRRQHCADITIELTATIVPLPVRRVLSLGEATTRQQQQNVSLSLNDDVAFRRVLSAGPDTPPRNPRRRQRQHADEDSLHLRRFSLPDICDDDEEDDIVTS